MTDVLKKLTAAACAVGELKGMGHVIPTQAMLINTVVLVNAIDMFQRQRKGFVCKFVRRVIPACPPC